MAKCHKETNHKGINLMRLTIINQGWYWEGLNIDIAKFIQECSQCTQINSTKHIRPPIKQIISTNHERYIIDHEMLDEPEPKTKEDILNLLKKYAERIKIDGLGLFCKKSTPPTPYIEFFYKPHTIFKKKKHPRGEFL